MREEWRSQSLCCCDPTVSWVEKAARPVSTTFLLFHKPSQMLDCSDCRNLTTTSNMHMMLSCAGIAPHSGSLMTFAVESADPPRMLPEASYLMLRMRRLCSQPPFRYKKPKSDRRLSSLHCDESSACDCRLACITGN